MYEGRIKGQNMGKPNEMYYHSGQVFEVRFDMQETMRGEGVSQ